MATQPELGLLPKRRTGCAFGNPGCPAFAGQNLNHAFHAVQTKDRLCYKALNNYPVNKLGASDGDIGHVKDFYFDDQTWAVRYVIADTGNWLPGRQVLISPYAFGGLHQAGKVLRVNLPRKQIENSPAIESHKPVSRQYEEEYHRYYGWPDYWQGGGIVGHERISDFTGATKNSGGQASFRD